MPVWVFSEISDLCPEFHEKKITKKYINNVYDAKPAKLVRSDSSTRGSHDPAEDTLSPE